MKYIFHKTIKIIPEDTDNGTVDLHLAAERAVALGYATRTEDGSDNPNCEGDSEGGNGIAFASKQPHAKTMFWIDTTEQEEVPK